jgi:hypothetical protein
MRFYLGNRALAKWTQGARAMSASKIAILPGQIAVRLLNEPYSVIGV